MLAGSGTSGGGGVSSGGCNGMSNEPSEPTFLKSPFWSSSVSPYTYMMWPVGPGVESVDLNVNTQKNSPSGDTGTPKLFASAHAAGSPAILQPSAARPLGMRSHAPTPPGADVNARSVKLLTTLLNDTA